MITYAELTNAVIENLEIDSSDLARFKVVSSINSAQLTLLNILPVDWLKNAVKTTTFNLLKDFKAYQWPSDFIRVRQIWLDYSAAITTTNVGKEASRYDDERFMKVFYGIGSAAYPFYEHIESGFAIDPIPTTDSGSDDTNGNDISVADGGRMRYVWRIPDIASGSPNQDSMLDDNLKNLLVWRGTSLAAMVENYNQQLAAEMNALYQDELKNFLPKEE